jgi:hypothetical protein
VSSLACQRIKGRALEHCGNLITTNYQHRSAYSESEIVTNPALCRKWDTLYLLGVAPPPLPVSPEDAWYHSVMNGHLRYAFLNECFIRDDVGDLFRASPNRFRDHLDVSRLYTITPCEINESTPT